MAGRDDRWLLWQAEQAGTSPGPSIMRALVLFAVVAAVLLALGAVDPDAATRRGGSFCDERPHWSVCSSSSTTRATRP